MTTHVLVPDSMRFLFEHALRDCQGSRSPDVMSIGDFVSLRMLFSSMDAGWTRHELIDTFVNAYNQRARESGLSVSLFIEAPKTSELGVES